MVRWMFGEEITGVRVLVPRTSSNGGALRDPLFLVLEMAGGALVDVEVSVNIRYGYDIRGEVVGENGTASLGSPSPVEVRAAGRIGTPVPADWRERFAAAYDVELQEWIDSIAHGGPPVGPSAWDGYAAAGVSDVTASQVDGVPLDDDEIMLNCYSLILGGDETARLSMVGAVLALVEHPDQWRALKRGEAGLDNAVEEMLRWTTPALHSGRTATADTEIAGRTVRAGDIVTVWNSSANRDERVFDAPDALRLDRSPNKHVTFAHGPHFCLGAYLARAEIAAVLSGLRSRVNALERTGPAGPVYSNFLNGMVSLPLALR
jgi:cytochrome P450